MKKIVTLLLVGIMAVSLTACGGFDASGYVQSILDVSYKGETKTYKKLTKSTEEEAQAIYEANLDTQVKIAEESQGYPISKELQKNYTKMMKKMFSLSKYKVKEAKKIKKGYSVTVSVEPLTIFSGVTDELNQKFQEYITTTDITGMSEEELSNYALQMQIDMLNEKMKKPSYGKEKDVTVTIIKDKDGSYGMTQEDYAALDAALFDVENM